MDPLSNAVTKQVSERYFARLFEDVIGYLNLYDFAKLKFDDLTGKTRRVSVETFWYSILRDAFAHPSIANCLPLNAGDIVRFKNVFLTQWTPKAPGQIWTKTGMKDFREGQKQIDRFVPLKTGEHVGVLDPYGKRKTLEAGLGTVRIQADESNDKYYALMNLVSTESSNCDYGVPVVVSRSVYKEYDKYSRFGGAPLAATLEGVLHLNQALPFKSLIPKAIGTGLSPETEDTLRHRPNLPRCFVYVASPLSLKFKTNRTHPDITAWTMFERDSDKNKYAYTYVQFNPTYQAAFDEANEFIKWYVMEFQGRQIITDYDGLVPRLESRIPLTEDPKKKKKEVRNWISGIDQWISKFVKSRAHNEHRSPPNRR